jgi:2-polyprenyl-3-methyl-5-hydroxy-6-metoxy-1,4-benzoquinol methylase
MNKELLCTVCSSQKHIHYISTKALMHKANKEKYDFSKCQNCESVFLTNSVKEEKLKDYYTDNYLPYKGSDAWGKFKSYAENSQRSLDKRRVGFVNKIVQNKKHFKLLDIGCGNPSFLDLAHQELKADCTGIDFSDNGWKNASFDSIKLIQTSIEDFEPNCFYDVITLWHYLEHDYHLQETVNKLYKWLQPGGKLIIEVPDYNSITAKIQKENWQGWHSPRHLTLFSAKGFKFLFNSNYWKIVKHLRYGTLDAFTLWWLGKMEKKQIDWNKPMEKEFWPLVFLKVVSFPFFLFENFFPMGIQLLVIEKK